MEDVPAANELFATETMAELCARQGRTADAVGIYRRLLGDAGSDDRRSRWAARLQALETSASARVPAAPVAPRTLVTPATSNAAGAPSVEPAPSSVRRSPLIVTTPVRSGQVIYAEERDLIVLAPVNPGAQLIADGHIHVYGPLRGRAVAGAHGWREARIFCQRLEAELVGIDVAYVTSDDLPAERFGKPSQISIRDGRCVIVPL